MALAEHNPSEVYARDKGVLSMSKEQLHDFASTKETNLPKRKKPKAVVVVKVKKQPHPAVSAIRNHGTDND